MNRDKFKYIQTKSVSSSSLTTLLLLMLSTLVFFCLPLNQLEILLFEFHQSSLNFSFFLISIMSILGSWQVMRAQHLQLSPFAIQILLCTALALIPNFYSHANSEQIWQYLISLLLMYLFFISLQQFNFSLNQHHFFLMLPILANWLFFILLMSYLYVKPINAFATFFKLIANSEKVLAILSLTSLPASIYLLSKLQSQKKFGFMSMLMLFTPLLCTSLLSLLPNSLYPIIGLFITLISQPFLFRHSSRLQHALWLSAFAIGFNSFLFSHHNSFNLTFFSSLEWTHIKQSINLFVNNLIYGVGIGQLEMKQLLLNIEQNKIPYFFKNTPSWLIKTITEGGFVILLSVISFSFIVLKRISNSEKGSRLLFLTLLLPSFYSVIFTGFSHLNPILPVILIMTIYWIDSQNKSYFTFKLTNTQSLSLINRSLFGLSLVFITSSVFLNFQALRVEKLSNNELEIYQLHPWWREHFYYQSMKRKLLNSIAENDEGAINQQLSLKKGMLASKPTPAGYQEFINLAKQAEKTELALQSLREAKQLFPSYSFY